MRYVFSHKEDMSRSREFVIFIVLSVIGLIINDVLMWAGTELVSIDYRIVKIFADGCRHGVELHHAQDFPRCRQHNTGITRISNANCDHTLVTCLRFVEALTLRAQMA